MKALLLNMAMWSVTAASACSCIDVGLAGHFKNAEVVFEAISLGSQRAEPTEAMPRGDERITMRITKVYKGDLKKGSVQVFTSSSFASCGSWLPFGGRYLVFAGIIKEHGGEDPMSPAIHTGMCWGNKFYPFWRFRLRRNVRRLTRGEELPKDSRWSGSPGF
ncbi:MAG: hypothetical protein KF905_16885 [Flavobacteriales bacterium]|nr:hypothetical protein [Flavobacteriales bacterium]